MILPMEIFRDMPWRALLVGVALSILVTLYSAYAGLKIGGVYWPILTTTIASMAILGFLGKTSKNEINIAQTAGSAGGLVAAGVIFTIPAMYLLGIPATLYDILLVSLSGGLLGVLFSYPLRQQMVEKDRLPYADGTAAAALIAAGDAGGRKTREMGASFGAGAIVALLRDVLKWIPQAVSLASVGNPAARIFNIGISLSLIPIAGGFLIGFVFTTAWFSGAALTNFVIMPFLVETGQAAGKLAVLNEVARPMGIGIVIGAALAYFALVGLPRIIGFANEMADGMRNAPRGKTPKKMGTPMAKGFVGGLLVLAALLSITLSLDAGMTALALIFAMAMAFVGARVTGEMNVDPMEIFAMIALLVAKFAFGSSAGSLVMLAAVVCISAGVAGSMMQDLKTGHLLGTDPGKQMVAQVAGVIAGSLVIGLVVMAIAGKFGFGGTEFPALQAMAVKELANGTHVSTHLGWGMILGALMTIASHYVGSGAVPIAFGIGMYAPIELSFPIFIGGIIRYASDLKGMTKTLRIYAAGAIAGEGIVGALNAVGSAAWDFLK